MAVWPVTLPQSVSWQGYARRIQDTRIRTTVESGPPKVRSRFRARVDQQDIPVVYFTKAQWVLLDTFYTTTLAQGVLPFDWIDPITGATVSFRFVKPPQFGQMLGPDTIPVTLQLEVLP
jgi:hypothetical protein